MLTITVTKVPTASDQAPKLSDQKKMSPECVMEAGEKNSGHQKLVDLSDQDDEFESELTSLTWLTELKNITNLAPSDCPVNDQQHQQQQPTTRFNKFINQVRRSQESYQNQKEKYETQCDEKPPFNYAQIIAMAMLEEPSGRLTLQQICQWIQDRFAYYKFHKNWNNSIRHNLSLNFFFSKISRSKNEKGKGGYWELAMDVSKSERKRIRQRNKTGMNIRRRPPATSVSSASPISGPDQSIDESSKEDTTDEQQTVQQEVQECVLDAEKQLLFQQEQERIHELEESIKYILNDHQPGTESGEFVTEMFGQEKFYRMIGDGNETTFVQQTPTLYTFNDMDVVVQLPIQIEQQVVQDETLRQVDSDDDKITVEDSGALSFNQEIGSEVLIEHSQSSLSAVGEIVLNEHRQEPLLQTCGPNVIVESIPYSCLETNGNFLPQMDTLDENELSRLILLNDHELVDKILDYDKGHVYF